MRTNVRLKYRSTRDYCSSPVPSSAGLERISILSIVSRHRLKDVEDREEEEDVYMNSIS